MLVRTDVPGLRLLARGKVRDIYEVPGEVPPGASGDPASAESRLLLVATDRLSAFDVVFAEGVPNKGRVLTQLAAWWFRRTRHIVENHLLEADFDAFPPALRSLDPALRGRSTLCRRAEVLPVECVVRGYLEGSAWKEYRATGEVTGIRLPKGLERRSRLERPIFTPATKAETGHDENIPFSRMVEIVGEANAETMRDAALRLFAFASAELDAKGIVLADTKFEFGLRDGRVVLIDEALTPDSSRFWVKGETTPSGEPVSFDKQFVRDYLETLDWDKRPPAPSLPEEILERTAGRYLEIFERITGSPL